MNNDPSIPMNLAEARMIVAAATTADLAAPGEELSAALDVLRNDPAEWAAWLAEHQRDQCIASAFSTVAPPPGLRDQILAAHGAQQRVHPRRRFVLAWAAGLAVMGGAGIAARWMFGRPSSPVAAPHATLASAASWFLDREWDHVFEHMAGTLGELRQFLESSGAPGVMEPGEGFDRLATIGCRRFPWKEQVAVLVCFRTPGDTAIVHVVSVPRTALGPEAPEALSLFREGRWHAASWIRGGRAYVALSDQPLEPGQWGRV
jgi:hypothetical protein